MGKIFFIGFVLFFIGCGNSEHQEENATPPFTPTVFSEEDIYWDKDTKPYKDILIAQVNRIHANDPGCRDIEPASLSKSLDKGTEEDPVFFVTCGLDSSIHNVFFLLSSAKAGIIAPKAIDKTEAMNNCTEAIIQNASFPRSVNMHIFGYDSGYVDYNGDTHIAMEFDAKNALGNTLEFKAYCTIKPNGYTSVSISQQ